MDTARTTPPRPARCRPPSAIVLLVAAAIRVQPTPARGVRDRVAARSRHRAARDRRRPHDHRLIRGLPGDRGPERRSARPRLRAEETGASTWGRLAFGRSLGAVRCRDRRIGVGSVGLVDHRRERQLAAVVDLRDLDEDLLADAEHVFDVLDALATGELADLADVQQAVLAGQQRDERTERGDLHDGSEELLADLGVGRVARSR